MTRDHATCPRCSAPLVARAAEVPWCAACEWNLAAFDRVTRRRAGMVRARPEQAPAVILSEEEARRIDAVPAPCFARLRSRAAEESYT